MPLNGIPPSAALLSETVWLDAIRHQEAEREFYEYYAQNKNQSQGKISQENLPSFSHEIAQSRERIQTILKSMGVSLGDKPAGSSIGDMTSSSLLRRIESLETENGFLKTQVAKVSSKMDEVLIRFIKLESALLGYNVDSEVIKSKIKGDEGCSKFMEQRRHETMELFNTIIDDTVETIMANTQNAKDRTVVDKTMYVPKIMDAIDQILILQNEDNIKRLQQWRDLFSKKSEVNIAVTNGPTTTTDDDDIDLFGSDEETEEEKKLKEERVKAYETKKAKKPALIAKSSLLIDVKPWDDETPMKELEDAVKSIEMDGLKWGASKLVPLAYGIQKLQIVATIEDDKVGVEELTELIEANENLVQSVDIAAFNKL